MRDIGYGIIGLGYIGNVHLRHALRTPNARLVAVADLSKSALRKAKEAGVRKTYTDYNQLLRNPEVDAVVISVPTHLHLDCAVKSAEANKHILLEKPIAKDPEDAKAIVSAAKRNGVKLMIGYPLRFNSDFQNLMQEINSGALGDVETAYAANISSGPFFHRAEGYAPVPVPEWWFNRELTGGGVLIDLGSHMINLLRWYFGEITDIRSHLRHRFNLDLEDSATCLAKFRTGTTATIDVGWFSQEYKLKVELHGTAKSATVQQRPGNLFLTVVKMLTSGVSSFYKPHFAEIQHFTSCIINDLSPTPSGQDGLRDIEAIEKAYQNRILLD